MLEKDLKKSLLIGYKKSINNYQSFRVIQSKRKEINKKYQEILRKDFNLFKYYLGFNDESVLDYIKRSFTENVVRNSFIINSVRIYDAWRQKQRYIKRKITKLFDLFPNHLYFLTLTFDDEFIFKINNELVLNIFRSNFNYYILNEDFSPEKNRRHYHLLVVSDYTNRKLAYNQFKALWEYGFIYLEKVNCRANLSAKKLTRYILKFTNHSIKDKTRNLYYSCGVKKL